MSELGDIDRILERERAVRAGLRKTRLATLLVAVAFMSALACLRPEARWSIVMLIAELVSYAAISEYLNREDDE